MIRTFIIHYQLIVCTHYRVSKAVYQFLSIKHLFDLNRKHFVYPFLNTEDKDMELAFLLIVPFIGGTPTQQDTFF